ncbi:MAG: SCO family protein [Flavobacteriales bacterium]|jgi:protein SCO1/2
MMGCSSEPASKNAESLPFFGEFDIELTTAADGTVEADTTYYPIPKFSFVNQDSVWITQKDYEGNITLVDFFFTDCPSICPVMSAQMARLQAKFSKEYPNLPIRFLSFSVKPETDTPAKLKAYATGIGADLSRWNFLTGKPQDIYDLAQEGFLLTAFPSDTAAGGIFHTDKVTLLDRQLRMRGYYDGTSTKSMDELFMDAVTLSQEN